MLTVYKTTFVNKRNLVSNVFLFTFKLNSPSEFNFIPGQYLILRVDGKPRLYSIASSSSKKNIIEFIIELFPGGLASTYLEELKIEEEVSFQGPAGQFQLRENDKQKIFLVTGTGIAPVRSIFSSLVIPSVARNLVPPKAGRNASLDSSSPPSAVPRNDSGMVYLFWGLKTYQDVYLFEELKNYGLRITDYNFKICLSREKNLEMIPEPDRKYFEIGHIDTCLFQQFNNLTMEQFEFYLCGGRNVVESIRQILLSKNISPENIVFEKF